MGITPERTCSMVLSSSARQSSGAMNMSMPALSAAGQLELEQPSTSAWPFQSPTTKPSKPSRPLRTSVSSSRLPCILRPCHEEKEAITVWTPASVAET